ncbi:hypothetical protein LTR86_008256 [Recurvomyces mirabilis]|nr:hypothetical protein LTR86_008256 [Recurvomyces mirabilis]
MSSLVFRYGEFTASSGWSTRPFHLSDLVPPVPHSIYNLQPDCMKQYEILTEEAGQLRGLTPENFACNAGPYAPIIAVPQEVSALNSEWDVCLPWYGGLYDPPEALQPTAVEATPTHPATLTTTSASPSQKPTITSVTATTVRTSSTSGAGAPVLGSNGSGSSVLNSPAVASTATSLAVAYSPAIASTASSLSPDKPADPAATSTETSNDQAEDPNAASMPSGEPWSATSAATSSAVSLDAGNSVLSILEQATRTSQKVAIATSTPANVGNIIASVLGMQSGQDPASTSKGSGGSLNSYIDPGSTSGQQTIKLVPQGSVAGFPPSITLGGSIVTQDPPSNYLIGSQTLVPGGPAITAGGTVLALAPSASALVVDGHTTMIAQAAPAGESPSSVTKLVMAGSTLAPGSSIVVQGTTYSLPSSGGGIYVNGVETLVWIPSDGSPLTLGSVVMTPKVVAVATEASLAQLTLGAHPLQYSQSGNAFVFGTQTLTPGAQITAKGQTLSLQSSGVVVVNGSITRTLTSQASSIITTGPNLLSYSQSGNAVIIGTKTLSVGAQVTVSGETISLKQSGVIVVNGSITKTLAPETTPLPTVLTLLDKTVAFTTSGSAVVVGGQVLDPGSTIVIDGVTLTLPTGSTRPMTVTGSAQATGPQSTTRTSVAAGGTFSSSQASGAKSLVSFNGSRRKWEWFATVLLAHCVLMSM